MPFSETGSEWRSCHGTAAVPQSIFGVTVSEAKAVIKPTEHDKLTGTVSFPLSSVPQNAVRATRVDVDFSGKCAIIGWKIMAGRHKVCEDITYWVQQFTQIINANINKEAEGQGLALMVTVRFQSLVDSDVCFESVGVEFAVRRSESLKICSGIWNSEDVRGIQQLQLSTMGTVELPRDLFSKPPKVVVSIARADVRWDKNFRVHVYADSITATEFVVHGDCWAVANLYSCRVAWVAYGY